MRVPRPEPGLVISYSYLWHREHGRGEGAGRKDRPAVILLSIEDRQGGTTVIVLAITHSRPDRLDDAVEVPAAIRRHLGLDDEPSWVVVSEGNRFLWPGYDLRLRHNGGYAYGFLPPKFFAKVKDAFIAFHRRHRTSLIPRD